MTISPTAISDCQLLECVLIAVRALCRQQGYMAKGWLGLILGQSVWHAFFDAAIPTDETFDQQMDVSQGPVLTIIFLVCGGGRSVTPWLCAQALVREIGDRGKAKMKQLAGGASKHLPQVQQQPMPAWRKPAGMVTVKQQQQQQQPQSQSTSTVAGLAEVMALFERMDA